MFISVIVPIYNVEKYLKNCIESVINQSFSDFELILVDDGSKDKSGEICDKYSENDKRIKVIHKENGGLVSARQAGIRLAEGEYIFNLDGDDSIESDTFETVYEIIKNTGADIISFSYRQCRNNGCDNIIGDPVSEGLYEKNDIKEHIFPKLLTDGNMEHMTYFLSGKVVKRELLIKYQLDVSTKISLGEDLCCTFPCYLQAEKVYISKKAVYLYTERDDSLSKDFNTRQLNQLEIVIDTLKNMAIIKPEDFESQIARYCAYMCFAILAAAAEGNHFKSLKKIEECILDSTLITQLQEAEFQNITIKSKISVFLIKRKRIRTAFLFLNLCKRIKGFLKG